MSLSSQRGWDPKVENLGTGGWMLCWVTSEHKDGGGGVGRFEERAD